VSIRRNFIHNCFVHRACAWMWLAADIYGLCGFNKLKSYLVKRGEHIHETNCYKHWPCRLYVSLGFIMDISVLITIIILILKTLRVLGI
jgi:hypothetical protein